MQHLSHEELPIIAQCTPSGAGALALLRLSGATALDVAKQITILSSRKDISKVDSHTIHLGWIIDAQGSRIDQVLLSVMRAPRTFTGEDVVEMSCHNNPFIIEAIIERALTCGARLAQEGEFTRRAVLNAKIDLLQAEAINELIHAQSQFALKKSLSQIQGTLSCHIATIEHELLKALAFTQASFEFIDEEMEFAPTILNAVNKIQKTIVDLKKSFDKQQQIRQGIRIALLGSVNAGKSSLFNAIIGSSRAIVTNIAGTTRDTIEAGMYRNGTYWTLVDTAGLRQTDDIIEHEGITRSWQEAHKADIILLVIDAARTMTSEEKDIYTRLENEHAHKTIVVFNKIDAAKAHMPYAASVKTTASVCNTDTNSITQLTTNIQTMIDGLFKDIESPFLLTKRQHNLLLQLECALKEVELMLTGPVSYELLAIHLNDALASLSELSGKSISEAGMDMVFREFCVGK